MFKVNTIAKNAKMEGLQNGKTLPNSLKKKINFSPQVGARWLHIKLFYSFS